MKSSVVHQSTILTYAGRSLSTLSFFLSFYCAMRCTALLLDTGTVNLFSLHFVMTSHCHVTPLISGSFLLLVKSKRDSVNPRRERLLLQKQVTRFTTFTDGPNGFKLLSRSNFFSAKSKGQEKSISISVFLRLVLWGRGHPLPMTLHKRFTSYVVGRKNVQLSLFITNHIITDQYLKVCGY